MRRGWRKELAVVAVLQLCACSTVGYYAHVVHGESALLAARRPVAEVLADPATVPALKERLRLAEQARAFASDHLELPRNRSYTSYADLHRPFASWIVFAAPEFSLQPYPQCFPVAGCVAYRGFFDERRAQDYARQLRARGLETWIDGAPAFSTLGWFADPILDSMLRWSDDDRLAATIFHELAHQRLYVRGDTGFNESFATFVQREGLRQWRMARGLPEVDDVVQQRQDSVERLLLATRARLQALYASGLPADAMRERKRAEIARLRADYARMRDTQWDGDHRFDAWIDGEVNNARLLPFGLYRQWVPAFAAIHRQAGGDWEAFYAAATELAHRDAATRARQLEELARQESDKPDRP